MMYPKKHKTPEKPLYKRGQIVECKYQEGTKVFIKKAKITHVIEDRLTKRIILFTTEGAIYQADVVRAIGQSGE